MNQDEIKNYAIDLNELFKNGQLLEYARLVSEVYTDYSTDITMDIMEHLKFLRDEGV